MTRSKGRTGRPYRRRRDQLRRAGAPCHVCGKPIDYTLPHTDPMSFQMDHLVPLKFGGEPLDPNNLRASHRTCNRRKGTKDVTDVVIVPRSRSW